jgi:hypothetical protein
MVLEVAVLHNQVTAEQHVVSDLRISVKPVVPALCSRSAVLAVLVCRLRLHRMCRKIFLRVLPYPRNGGIIGRQVCLDVVDLEHSIEVVEEVEVAEAMAACCRNPSRTAAPAGFQRRSSDSETAVEHNPAVEIENGR